MVVQQAFDLAGAAVNGARNEWDWEISSTHDFKALSNQQNSPYPVKHYLTNMRDCTGKINLEPDPSKLLSPVMVCVGLTTYSHYKQLRLGYDP